MEEINKLIEEKGGVDFVTAEDLAPFSPEDKQKFYSKRRHTKNREKTNKSNRGSDARVFARQYATPDDMRELIKIFQEENPAGKDFRP